MSAPYQRHYDVGLLDDIHNYFPALLYEPERFSSVADVLSYVRGCVARRFDLFSAGQRGYDATVSAQQQRQRLPPQGPQPFAASPIQAQRGGFGSAVPRAAAVPATEIQIEIEEYAPRAAQRAQMPGLPLRAAQQLFPTEIESAASDILNLLNPNSTAPAFSPLSLLSLFNSLNTVNAGVGGGAAANFLDPVPVRPTAAQISEATALEIVDAEEEVCAICQDTMEPGSESRVIHHCDHRFHPGCIDTWFQRDVHCPVCRHDIRGTAAGQN
jgi:hypothetical protein